MEFIAVDVETANANLASICQIGVAHFVNDTIAGEWKSYVDPQDHFDGINVSIHGIDESVVAGALVFGELVDKIRGALDQRVVVTHTAFDKAALSRAGARCHMPPLSCTWLDSACVARRAWKQFSRSGYGLQNVCATIGYQFRPHDALEDAKAAGQVLIAAMAQTGLDLEGWLKRVRQPIDPALKERIVRYGNPDGDLYGEVLVFTGALTIGRREAAEFAANMGCEVDPGVTKRTTILVVGDQDVQRLAGHEKSSKHRKAEELIRNGQAIRIVRETDFCDLVRLSFDLEQSGNVDAVPAKSVDVTQPTEVELGGPVIGSRPPEVLTASERIQRLAEAVKQLKRNNNLVEAERMLLEECERQEAESVENNWGVAPWYYEQLAIIYRKQSRFIDEVAVLERYDRQNKAPGRMPPIMKARLERARLAVNATARTQH